MNSRVPPHNLDAEKAVLGGLMIEPERWDEVSELITADDLYQPSHRKIFQAIQALAKSQQAADIVTINNYLSERGELEGIGGPAYLGELLDQTPTAANIISYATIVRDKSVLRNVIRVSQGFIERAMSPDFDEVSVFLDSVEQEVFKVSQSRGSQGLVDASELVKASMKKIEELYAQKQKVTGISSGFMQLDDLTAGFQPGELIIIAARPSMGKTAFSLNVTLNAALHDKRKVAYFSVEMAKEQVMMRMLASAAKVRLGDLRVGQVGDRDWRRLIETAASLSETGLFIDDTAGISPFEVRAKARRLKSTHGLDMIIIDYLQLMGLKTRVESREREVSEISKLLKMIAKELRIPVIALAQLNRGVEGRSDRRPMLSDLRESGSIEQDADVIMMLYREDYYDRDNPELKGLAEVIIGKQRNGPTDTVKLRWMPEFGIFDNYIPGPDAPMPPSPGFGGPSVRRPGPQGSSGEGRKPLNLAPGS